MSEERIDPNKLSREPFGLVVKSNFVKGRGWLATAQFAFLGNGEQPTEAAARAEALRGLASSIDATVDRLRRESS